MTLQTIKIGKQQYILIAKRDFERLTAHSREKIEDVYWTRAALKRKLSFEPASKRRFRWNKSIANSSRASDLSAQGVNESHETSDAWRVDLP